MPFEWVTVVEYAGVPSLALVAGLFFYVLRERRRSNEGDTNNNDTQTDDVIQETQTTQTRVNSTERRTQTTLERNDRRTQTPPPPDIREEGIQVSQTLPSVSTTETQWDLAEEEVDAPSTSTAETQWEVPSGSAETPGIQWNDVESQIICTQAEPSLAARSLDRAEYAFSPIGGESGFETSSFEDLVADEIQEQVQAMQEFQQPPSRDHYRESIDLQIASYTEMYTEEQLITTGDVEDMLTQSQPFIEESETTSQLDPLLQPEETFIRPEPLFQEEHVPIHLEQRIKETEALPQVEDTPAESEPFSEKDVIAIQTEPLFHSAVEIPVKVEPSVKSEIDHVQEDTTYTTQVEIPVVQRRLEESSVMSQLEMPQALRSSQTDLLGIDVLPEREKRSSGESTETEETQTDLLGQDFVDLLLEAEGPPLRPRPLRDIDVQTDLLGIDLAARSRDVLEDESIEAQTNLLGSDIEASVSDVIEPVSPPEPAVTYDSGTQTGLLRDHLSSTTAQTFEFVDTSDSQPAAVQSVSKEIQTVDEIKHEGATTELQPPEKFLGQFSELKQESSPEDLLSVPAVDTVDASTETQDWIPERMEKASGPEEAAKQWQKWTQWDPNYGTRTSETQWDPSWASRTFGTQYDPKLTRSTRNQSTQWDHKFNKYFQNDVAVQVQPNKFHKGVQTRIILQRSVATMTQFPPPTPERKLRRKKRTPVQSPVPKQMEEIIAREEPRVVPDSREEEKRALPSALPPPPPPLWTDTHYRTTLPPDDSSHRHYLPSERPTPFTERQDFAPALPVSRPRTSADEPSSQAFVTMVSNDAYGLGALVLGHSLRQTQGSSPRPTVVLVTGGVSEEMRQLLGDVYDHVREVSAMDSHDTDRLALMDRPELGITLTKLRAWSDLDDFNKCVFLDADSMVLTNIDELFKEPGFAAAPDYGWPDIFNSGVFVYAPDKDTFEELVKLAIEKGSFDGGDQGILNQYFGDDWKRLSCLYNAQYSSVYTYLPAYQQFGQGIKVVHFLGAWKPWMVSVDPQTRRVTSALAQDNPQARTWLAMFEDKVLPKLSHQLLQKLQSTLPLPNKPLPPLEAISGEEESSMEPPVEEPINIPAVPTTSDESLPTVSATPSAPAPPTDGFMQMSFSEGPVPDDVQQLRWEFGTPDFLGQDKFENILDHLKRKTDGKSNDIGSADRRYDDGIDDEDLIAGSSVLPAEADPTIDSYTTPKFIGEDKSFTMPHLHEEDGVVRLASSLEGEPPAIVRDESIDLPKESVSSVTEDQSFLTSVAERTVKDAVETTVCDSSPSHASESIESGLEKQNSVVVKQVDGVMENAEHISEPKTVVDKNVIEAHSEPNEIEKCPEHPFGEVCQSSSEELSKQLDDEDEADSVPLERKRSLFMERPHSCETFEKCSVEQTNSECEDAADSERESRKSYSESETVESNKDSHFPSSFLIDAANDNFIDVEAVENDAKIYEDLLEFEDEPVEDSTRRASTAGSETSDIDKKATQLTPEAEQEKELWETTGPDYLGQHSFDKILAHLKSQIGEKS